MRASRFEFLTGSFAPVLVGGAVAWWETGGFHWGLWLLTLLGLMLIHSGANLANDYFDHLTGDDAINQTFLRPFTGGSRVIQQGLATPRQVLLAALICLTAGSALGLLLAFLCGWPLLVLGVIGVFTGFFYTAPPLALVYRGVGEIFIALDFGVLPVLGAYFVQTGHFSGAALWASLPVALLITAILFINEFPDYEADRAVNKRHWVVRLGPRRAAVAYAAGMVAVYLVLIAAVMAGALPPLTLLVGLSLPLMARGINTALREHSHPLALLPANAATVLTHLSFSLLLSLGLIVDKLLK
jgi:1,4-dihydroxy-2-naphthoate octaprenyltransferase